MKLIFNNAIEVAQDYSIFVERDIDYNAVYIVTNRSRVKIDIFKTEKEAMDFIKLLIERDEIFINGMATYW